MNAYDKLLASYKELEERVQRLEENPETLKDRWFKRSLAYKGRRLTIDNLMLLVSDYTGIAVSEIKGNGRMSDIMFARQAYCYLAYRTVKKNWTLDFIGDLIDKNHATVINAIKRMEDRIDTDESARQDIAAMAEVIKGMI